MNGVDLKAVLMLIVRHPLFLLFAGTAFIIAAMIGSSILAYFATEALGPNDWLILASGIIIALVATGFYWLFVRYVERKPFSDFGLPGAGREWLFGVGLGFGAMAATIGTIALLGGYRVTGFNSPQVLVSIAGMAIMSGVWEEIFTRGILFRFVEQWLGSWSALVASALFFGAAHLGNPNATTLAGVAIALEAGILLAAVYMMTRRLWAVIGLHMAWNFTQGGIFGVAVSGFESQGLLANQMSGSPLLTGGAFGAEASLPAIIICTAIGLYCLRRAIKMGRIVPASWQRFKTGQATAP